MDLVCFSFYYRLIERFLIAPDIHRNEQRQQYYLHQFASGQPDLNYRNPEVVEAMKEVLVYWMDRGADGFRIDAVTLSPCSSAFLLSNV